MPLEVFINSGVFLLIPDLFGLACVIQKEENICVFTDAVVSKALQIDEEMVRHRNTATITMALLRAVTLGLKKEKTMNPAPVTLLIFSRIFSKENINLYTYV